MFAQIFKSVGTAAQQSGFSRLFKKDDGGWEGVPRDGDGKWTKLRYEQGKGFVGHDKPLTTAQQEQLKKVGPVPPAWTDVHLNPDPKADTQVKGRDAKGKQQIKQHPEAIARNASAKWDRVGEFHKTAAGPVMDLAAKVMMDKKRSQKERDLGAVVHLIAKTGFRIGSDVDTGAQEQAYGASTLEKRHIKVKGDSITFSFTGKKGVSQEKTITDPLLAKYLATKLPSLKPTEQVFTATDANARSFIKAAAGNDKFKPKDFRTWHGTGLALGLRKAMPAPTTAAEYKQKQNFIAQKVAEHLGNTKTVALSSYIAPMVWAKWDPKLAPQKKSKKEEGFAGIFDLVKVVKDDMVPFEFIWQSIEDAVNDDTEGDPPDDSGQEDTTKQEGGAAPFEVGAVTKAQAQPLYVCRPLVNVDDFTAWAKDQGFDKVIEGGGPDGLHVTITYSKEPVDWEVLPPKTGNLVITGGKRTVEPLGDKGAVVMKFSSKALQARWKAFRDAGASWDYESYTPHLTISYNAADVDLASVVPYAGPIILGPEVFEPINTDKEFAEKADLTSANLDGDKGGGGLKFEDNFYLGRKKLNGLAYVFGAAPVYGDSPAHSESMGELALDYTKPQTSPNPPSLTSWADAAGLSHVFKDSAASIKAWITRRRGYASSGATPDTAPDLAREKNMEQLQDHIEKTLQKQRAADIKRLGPRGEAAHNLLDVLRGEMGVAKRRGRAVKFVTQSGKILSGIEYRTTGPDYYIDYLGSLAPGQGVAWMTQIEHEAKQAGKGVRFTAVADAIPFYQKLGYKQHPSGKAGDMYKPHKALKAEADGDDVGALIASTGAADEVVRPDGLAHVFKK